MGPNTIELGEDSTRNPLPQNLYPLTQLLCIASDLGLLGLPLLELTGITRVEIFEALLFFLEATGGLLLRFEVRDRLFLKGIDLLFGAVDFMQ